jgi:hypothetical protein
MQGTSECSQARYALAVLVVILCGWQEKTVPRGVFNADRTVRFPDDYRRWAHIGTRIKTSGQSVLDGQPVVVPQVMNVYVEPAAYSQYKTSGTFPDGTQIVKEFSQIKIGQGCDQTTFVCSTKFGEGIFEERYQGVGMMIKDSKRFSSEQGNWAYFRFLRSGDKYQNISAVLGATQCAACHIANAAASDYVFVTAHIGLSPANAQ